ncbi:hypothetical protein XENOCAPTIV_028707 [Xenoophorus captivus]|uniref:FAD-binding domain-containing protein n=1 Tax=Xenoophorus captivus TaxID=1517983 RepID=A0ABV0R6K5_9TELE
MCLLFVIMSVFCVFLLGQCLIIGGGPCGLRTAIELALMGAKVVVIEKRDSFSRHNVLHLWPYTIHDLRGLGAKKFYGKFCAGAIDHISEIKTLFSGFFSYLFSFIQDYMDTQMLLSSENVNQEALLSYAREAADFGTNYQLPTLDYAMNHCGQPDVAMFDFTSMHASENAALVRERFGHQLLVALVGDSLLEVRDGMAHHAHFRC